MRRIESLFAMLASNMAIKSAWELVGSVSFERSSSRKRSSFAMSLRTAASSERLTRIFRAWLARAWEVLLAIQLVAIPGGYL